jgi:hypothetical protein
MSLSDGRDKGDTGEITALYRPGNAAQDLTIILLAPGTPGSRASRPSPRSPSPAHAAPGRPGGGLGFANGRI